jgi:ubiquinone/menaquinone biosynthesis C-methylase UbiE
MTEPPSAGLLDRLAAAGYDVVTSRVERAVLSRYRRRLLASAHGRVLDVGAGTGANLPHYVRGAISELILLEPSAGMLWRARRRARALRWEPTVLNGRAEAVPLPDGSCDTVVFTLSLCTVAEPSAALREARRLLRTGGTLLVLEHVRAPDAAVASWQDRATPIWRVLAGGCHPNRATRATIEAAGFTFESVDEPVERRIPLRLVQPLLVGRAHPAGD